MASVNQSLVSSFTTLTANLSRLSETEKLVVIGSLKELEDALSLALNSSSSLTALSKRRFEALISQNRQTIKTAYTNIHNQNTQYLSGVGAASVKGSGSIFNSMGVPLSSVAVTTEQYQALASNAMIRGASTKAWWSNQSRTLQDNFMHQMRMGYIAGETNDQLIKRVRGDYVGTRSFVIEGGIEKRRMYQGGIMDASYNQARSLVGTATNQVSSDARRLLFQKNGDVLKGIVQISTLDMRTTLQCAARDGKAWTLDGEPIGHTIPYEGGTPLHWGCRSVEVPMTKSWADLGADPKVDEEYLANINQTTRASMNGQVPASQTFDEWIRNQAVEDQIAYFGPKKYEIWKEGGLTLRQMLDQQGNPLTLDQLALAYGFQVSSAASLGQPRIPAVQQNALLVEQQAQKLAKEMNQGITDLIGVLEQTILDLKGNLPSRGNIVLLGSRGYNLEIAEDVIAFKARKVQLLKGYKEALVSKKRPSVFEQQMYEGLVGTEKEFFDDSIALALLKAK